MGIAGDSDLWVHPQIGRGSHGASQVAEGAAAGPSAEFSFWDLLDIVNPLQHIPVVSSIYRRITGDEISPHAQIIGATLYGGPVGFVIAANLVLVEEVAGQSIEDAVANAVFGAPEPEAEALADAGMARPAETATAAAVASPAMPEGPAKATTAVPGALPEPATLASPAPKMSESGSLAPASEGAVLTGEDALRAFSADLQGLGPAAVPPAPLPVWPGAALPVETREGEDDEPSRSPEDADSHDEIAANFTQKMMDGLRKYDLMTRAAADAEGARAASFQDSL